MASSVKRKFGPTLLMESDSVVARVYRALLLLPEGTKASTTEICRMAQVESNVLIPCLKQALERGYILRQKAVGHVQSFWCAVPIVAVDNGITLDITKMSTLPEDFVEKLPPLYFRSPSEKRAYQRRVSDLPALSPLRDLGSDVYIRTPMPVEEVAPVPAPRKAFQRPFEDKSHRETQLRDMLFFTDQQRTGDPFRCLAEVMDTAKVLLSMKEKNSRFKMNEVEAHVAFVLRSICAVCEAGRQEMVDSIAMLSELSPRTSHE